VICNVEIINTYMEHVVVKVTNFLQHITSIVRMSLLVFLEIVVEIDFKIHCVNLYSYNLHLIITKMYLLKYLSTDSKTVNLISTVNNFDSTKCLLI